MRRHHTPRLVGGTRAPLAILSTAFAVLATFACSLTERSGLTPGEVAPNSPVPSKSSPAPESTATPLPSLALLVAPQGDPMGDMLDGVMAELSTEAALRYEHVAEPPADLTAPRVDLAVVVTQIDDLGALAESYPRTQFIAVGLPGITPSANVTVIEPLSDRPDDVAFLAGYLAALVSMDWRVASLSQADSTAGASSRLAFANGAEFLCGLCRPVYPPYPDYPLDYRLSAIGDEPTRQALMAQVDRDGIEVVFVQQGLDDPELVRALVDAGVHLIGVGAPLDPTGWIASIQGDPAEALRSVWSSVVRGESGGSVELPLHVVVQDATRLTPGRYQHLQTIIDDLERGLIDTGVDPLTGGPD